LKWRPSRSAGQAAGPVCRGALSVKECPRRANDELVKRSSATRFEQKTMNSAHQMAACFGRFARPCFILAPSCAELEAAPVPTIPRTATVIPRTPGVWGALKPWTRPYNVVSGFAIEGLRSDSMPLSGWLARARMCGSRTARSGSTARRPGSAHRQGLGRQRQVGDLSRERPRIRRPAHGSD